MTATSSQVSTTPALTSQATPPPPPPSPPSVPSPTHPTVSPPRTEAQSHPHPHSQRQPHLNTDLTLCSLSSSTPLPNPPGLPYLPLRRVSSIMRSISRKSCLSSSFCILLSSRFALPPQAFSASLSAMSAGLTRSISTSVQSAAAAAILHFLEGAPGDLRSKAQQLVADLAARLAASLQEETAAAVEVNRLAILIAVSTSHPLSLSFSLSPSRVVVRT